MAAVRCFRNQTYRNRELVILDDGGDSTLENTISLLADRDIRFIRLDPGSMPLGALRNLAAEQARGEYVAQWDDDDLSHPRRAGNCKWPPCEHSKRTPRFCCAS